MPFAELCGKTCFSLLQGASRPEEMLERAKELGLAAIAIADRDGLYGSVRAHLAANKIGQPYLVGAEITCDDGAGSLVLVVVDHDGYRNVCRLLTRAHEGRPREEAALPIDELAAHAKGLVAIVPAPYDERLLGVVRDAFDDRAFLAAHRHLVADDGLREALVREAAARFHLAVVATARPLLHHASRKHVADVLQCIREKTTLDRAGARLAPNAEARLRSEAEMLRLFRDAPDRVARTVEVAEACRFSLSELRYDFPSDELAPGETPDDALARLVRRGERIRYPEGTPPSVAAQLDKELGLIAKLRVAQFFLSVHEIVEIARAKRILCQGRGSAANSAVCFVLGITAVDPARSSLLFERFLSAERGEPPDIDVDFEHERREEVIQAIYEKYGRGRAAMVSEVISYRGKSALRETGKAFGLSLEQVDRLASMDLSPEGSALRPAGKAVGAPPPGLGPRAPNSRSDALDARSDRIREVGLDPSDRRIRLILRIAAELQGFPRHMATHVGGFVLSARPLDEIAPVEPAKMPGRTVVPWDKDDIDALGFFKVDVLGLGMLTAIRKALELVHTGPARFDPIEALASIPPEDPRVYDAIGRADTVGVFQIESRAQMAMLPRLRPRKFYDLVIEVAIVRPGPIQGGMVHPYLRRRRGEEPATMPHPSLAPILERTLGVPLFQEQVMQIAIVGAGYSAGEADELRRDMAAWRREQRLGRHRDKLLRGFAERGIARTFGEMLFEQIKGFGEYGFPESHAASFALLVYASAWLKVHHPAEFACALLNSQPMGFYSPSSLVRDAQKHGVEVLAVSVERSAYDCTMEEGRLRLGFRLVRGLGEDAASGIALAREKAPFRDPSDLAHRAGLRRDQLDVLAEAGALDGWFSRPRAPNGPLDSGRRQAMWSARAPRAGGLFAGLATEEPTVKLPPLPKAEQLSLDYARVGLSIDDHPMRHLRAALAPKKVTLADRLAELRDGVPVTVAGVVLARQRPSTANGVVFVSIEDETGIANLVVLPKVFERFQSIARHARIVLAKGKLERTPKDPRKEPGTTPVIHVRVATLERLDWPELVARSRDFH